MASLFKREKIELAWGLLDIRWWRFFRRTECCLLASYLCWGCGGQGPRILGVMIVYYINFERSLLFARDNKRMDCWKSTQQQKIQIPSKSGQTLASLLDACVLSIMRIIPSVEGFKIWPAYSYFNYDKKYLKQEGTSAGAWPWTKEQAIIKCALNY